jgi:hypothetical protein
LQGFYLCCQDLPRSDFGEKSAHLQGFCANFLILPRFLGLKVSRICASISDFIYAQERKAICRAKSVRYWESDIGTDIDMRFQKNFLPQKSWQAKNAQKPAICGNSQYLNGLFAKILPRFPISEWAFRQEFLKKGP